MKDSVTPFHFDGEGTFVPSEIEKLDKNLSGVYAIFNDLVDGEKHAARWVYWGQGNIHKGLTAFLDDPCHFEYRPDMFGYILHPDTTLVELKKELGQLCKHHH